MSQNLVSLSFTDADLKKIDDAMTQLEGAFTGLVSLSPDQRKSLKRMGDRSEAFCRQSLAVLAQNPSVIPPSFDLAEAQSDLAALDQLMPRFMRLQRLVERADDTETALRVDIMSAARDGLSLLKMSGKAQGLDGLLQAMGERFARRPRATTPAAPATPAAATAPA